MRIKRDRHSAQEMKIKCDNQADRHSAQESGKKRDRQTTNVRYDIIIIILTTRGKKARVLRIVLAAERAAESLSSSQRNLEM